MRNNKTSILFLAILPLILFIVVQGKEEASHKWPSEPSNKNGHCTYNSVFWEGEKHENEDCFNFESKICDEIVKKCECSDCQLCSSEILKKCYEIIKECRPSCSPETEYPPSNVITTVKPPHCSKTCLHPYQCLLSFECRCPCGDCGYAVDTLFKPCDLYELCPPDYLKVMYSCCCNISTPVIEGGKIPAGCKCDEYHLTNILNYITNV